MTISFEGRVDKIVIKNGSGWTDCELTFSGKATDGFSIGIDNKYTGGGGGGSSAFIHFSEEEFNQFVGLAKKLIEDSKIENDGEKE